MVQIKGWTLACASSMKASARATDIVIGGVVPELDQIVGVGVPIVSDLHIGTTR